MFFYSSWVMFFKFHSNKPRKLFWQQARHFLKTQLSKKKKDRSLHIFFKPLLPFSYANTIANWCCLKSKDVPSFAFPQKPSISYILFNSKDTNLRGQEKCKAPEIDSVMITLTTIFLLSMTCTLGLLDK